MPKKSDPKALRRLAEMQTSESSTSAEVQSGSERGLTRQVVVSLVLPGQPSYFRRQAVSLLFLFAGVALPIAVLLVLILLSLIHI